LELWKWPQEQSEGCEIGWQEQEERGFEQQPQDEIDRMMEREEEEEEEEDDCDMTSSFVFSLFQLLRLLYPTCGSRATGLPKIFLLF